MISAKSIDPSANLMLSGSISLLATSVLDPEADPDPYVFWPPPGSGIYL